MTMHYEVVYEFGEIVCEQSGEKAVCKLRTRKGKQYCEVVIPIPPSATREQIHWLTESALDMARRAVEPFRRD